MALAKVDAPGLYPLLLPEGQADACSSLPASFWRRKSSCLPSPTPPLASLKVEGEGNPPRHLIWEISLHGRQQRGPAVQGTGGPWPLPKVGHRSLPHKAKNQTSYKILALAERNGFLSLPPSPAHGESSSPSIQPPGTFSLPVRAGTGLLPAGSRQDGHLLPAALGTLAAPVSLSPCAWDGSQP